MAANRFDQPPTAYPQPEPGTKARQIDHPVDRPETPDVRTMIAKARDGTERDIRKTLGMPDPADVPDEDRVRWTRWPP